MYYVADGDTLRITFRGGQIKVKLAGIDAPEKGQPYGEQAAAVLGSWVLGKSVTVRDGNWAQGNLVGRVFVGERDINAALVGEGLAWSSSSGPSQPTLQRLEQRARKAGKGLWADPGAIAPWEWRARHGSSWQQASQGSAE